MSHAPIRLAVLISGGGTTLKNLIDQVAGGHLDADIRLVVSSNPAAPGLGFARQAGIATRVVARTPEMTDQQYQHAVFEPCREAQVELVVMGGFLKHVLIPTDFHERVINIHPSLIPQFCGKGFYGRRVHEAVLAAGVAQSGCTVHFVDDQYDHGPILLQRVVAVNANDTPESLAARVFAEECQALPEAIRQVASRRPVH